jgi:UDP-glucose 4-epimerase
VTRTVLVTGATGFVGTALMSLLKSDPSIQVRAAMRDAGAPRKTGVSRALIGAKEGATDWSAAVAGVDTIIHLAARVHVMRDDSANPLAEFRRVNVDGTVHLARQARAAGVRRLVFVSSIKVNGESGLFRETDEPQPVDPYGVSKLEAEQALRGIAAETGMEVVIVRPPLVYGPGVKANFLALLKAIDRGFPLPLGALDNRRSLIAVDNLADFLAVCATAPAAANETFLVSDGRDLSSADLVKGIARAMGRQPRLVPVPASILSVAAAMLGKREVAKRLIGSLQLDITKARERLGWSPPVSVEEGLARAVLGYRRR